MDLKSQLKIDWNRYFYHQPPVEMDTNESHHFFSVESTSSAAMLENNQDPLFVEQANVKQSHSHSFSMDARIRLDNLKLGCNSPSLSRATDRMLNKYNREKEVEEESKEEESALDMVELLDVEEEEVQDEESWLYESPKKKKQQQQQKEEKEEVEEEVSVEGRESALGWCRRVLDNPSPETEAACRLLMNRLHRGSGSHLYRRPAVFHYTGKVSSQDKTPVSTAQNNSHSSDYAGLSISNDSITSSYKLQDITDVHIMARIQEASLRQDYVSSPASASLRGGPESLPPYSYSTFRNAGEFTLGSKSQTSSFSRWQHSPSSLSSSTCQTPTPAAAQNQQSPRLARLQQQVTQFKLLKLAQNQGTSPCRTRSPLRTSLRSLQAVRNSRSFETEDLKPAEESSNQPTGGSPMSVGSMSWPPSLPAASTAPVRDPSARVKRLHRSQSASPCRIPHPARGLLSIHGRVFASADRSTTVAWGGNVTSTQR